MCKCIKLYIISIQKVHEKTTETIIGILFKLVVDISIWA